LKKIVMIGLALALSFILAGCDGNTPPTVNGEPPTVSGGSFNEPSPIRVLADETEVSWFVALNKWNGAIFDRLDNFHVIMSETSFDDLPIVGNGETVTIQFLGDVPDSYTLTEFILRENGDLKFNVPGMEYDIAFDNNGFGEFVVKPNISTALSSYSGDYDPGNTIKGYRLVVSWGDVEDSPLTVRESEYTFIVRGDAFTQFNHQSESRFVIEEWDGGADQALEQIYEDQFHRYYLSSIRSHFITVAFADGQRISLGDAISQGMVTMDELIAAGLNVIKESNGNYEVGRVWLVADGMEIEPGEHFMHGATDTENGFLSASGISMELWLTTHFDELPIIRYAPDMQIVIDGNFGRVVTLPSDSPVYHEGYRQIGLLAGDFVDGVATVTLPEDDRTFLVYVNVHWSGGSDEFTLLSYIFKLVRD